MFSIEQQHIYVQQIKKPEYKHYWSSLLVKIIANSFDTAVVEEYITFLFSDNTIDIPYLCTGDIDSVQYGSVANPCYTPDMLHVVDELLSLPLDKRNNDAIAIFVDYAMKNVLEIALSDSPLPPHDYGLVFSELSRLRYQIYHKPYVITEDTIRIVAATFYHSNATSTLRVFKSMKHTLLITEYAYEKLLKLIFKNTDIQPSLEIYDVLMVWVHRNDHYDNDTRNRLFDIIVRHKNKMVLIGEYHESTTV